MAKQKIRLGDIYKEFPTLRLEVEHHIAGNHLTGLSKLGLCLESAINENTVIEIDPNAMNSWQDKMDVKVSTYPNANEEKINWGTDFDKIAARFKNLFEK